MLSDTGQGRSEKVLKGCGVTQKACPIEGKSVREKQVRMKRLSPTEKAECDRSEYLINTLLPMPRAEAGLCFQRSFTNELNKNA